MSLGNNGIFIEKGSKKSANENFADFFTIVINLLLTIICLFYII